MEQPWGCLHCSIPGVDSAKVGRALIVFIDGTSNKFGEFVRTHVAPHSMPTINCVTQNSNVVELCSRVVDNDRQIKFYTSGIGTSPDPQG